MDKSEADAAFNRFGKLVWDQEYKNNTCRRNRRGPDHGRDRDLDHGLYLCPFLYPDLDPSLRYLSILVVFPYREEGMQVGSLTVEGGPALLCLGVQ